MNTERIFNDLVTGRANRIPAWDIASVVSDKVKYIEKLLYKSMEADNGSGNLSP